MTGIAVFDPADIKGVFADFDPSGVPEGMRQKMTPCTAAGPLARSSRRLLPERRKSTKGSDSAPRKNFCKVWPSLMADVGGTVPR